MQRTDVFVIGGGGTGSDVTSALAGAGLGVVMAERELLGGECSNYGCDPTKAMLKAAAVAATARRASEFGVVVGEVRVDFDAVMRRVRRLIDQETSAGARPYEERGVRVFMQEARLAGEHRVELADGTTFEADRIVLATGSKPTVPPVDGLQSGGYWTNREAIWHGDGIPDSLAIMGAGAIGVEFAQIYSRFGSKVTLIEALDRCLPLEDEDSSRAIRTCLEAEGIAVSTGARVTKAGRQGGDRGGGGSAGPWQLTLDGRTEPIEAGRLLVATGRRPALDGLDLPAAGVDLNEQGHFILTETLRTTAPHIWAGGDATGEHFFTHVGGYEAEVIAADILGRPFPRDYRVVPRVTFCQPEVASVGLTEAQARREGVDVSIGMAEFARNTLAFLEDEPAGHVKLVGDAATGQVIGGHIVGEGAGELLGEVIATMAGRVRADTVARAIHAYPTMSETVREAMRALGE